MQKSIRLSVSTRQSRGAQVPFFWATYIPVFSTKMCSSVKFYPILILFSLSVLPPFVFCGPVAPVTKITTVLELFNPISLVKFFEFNDQFANVSGECIRDIFWYLEAIEQDYQWPIKCKCASELR